MGRISIAGLLGWVVACAIGFAAVVDASDLWLGGMLALMIAVLLGCLLGVIVGRWRGGSSLGFAVFGWGYFLLGLQPVGLNDHMRQLSDPLARWAFDVSNPRPVPPLTMPPPASTGLVIVARPPISDVQAEYNQASADFRHRRANAGLIGLWLTILLMAMVGAIVGTLLERNRPAVASPPLPPR